MVVVGSSFWWWLVLVVVVGSRSCGSEVIVGSGWWLWWLCGSQSIGQAINQEIKSLVEQPFNHTLKCKIITHNIMKRNKWSYCNINESINTLLWSRNLTGLTLL